MDSMCKETDSLGVVEVPPDKLWPPRWSPPRPCRPSENGSTA
jgi:hypothetical protein